MTNILSINKQIMFVYWNEMLFLVIDKPLISIN